MLNLCMTTTVMMGLYSPTIPKNFLCLVLQIFVYLGAFECNTTSEWLGHTVKPIKSCVTFKFTKSWRKSQRMVGKLKPRTFTIPLHFLRKKPC